MSLSYRVGWVRKEPMEKIWVWFFLPLHRLERWEAWNLIRSLAKSLQILRSICEYLISRNQRRKGGNHAAVRLCL